MVDGSDDRPEEWGDETVRNPADEERPTAEERPAPTRQPDPWLGDTERAEPVMLAGLSVPAVRPIGDPWAGDTFKSPPPHPMSESQSQSVLARPTVVLASPAEEVAQTARSPSSPSAGARATTAPVSEEAPPDADTLERPAHPDTDRSPPERRLGGYLLKRRLAAGGMAEVFLAEMTREGGFRKTVVVKRILPERATDQRFVEMFLREGRTAARLNHPNVVQVFELGRDGDEYFLVMEHVEGVTLAALAHESWRRGRPLPIELILRALADAAAGLHHAHELRGPNGQPLNMIHRDVSPDNLMITPEGITKVVDFGIARPDGDRVTEAGELKGKLAYIAPEQARGEDLDRRCDIFALGATAFYLLTGEKPIKARSSVAMLVAAANEPRRRASAVNPRVPANVDELVWRCMAQRAAERPQTAAELSEALLQLLPSTRANVASFVCQMMDSKAAGDLVERQPGFAAADTDTSRAATSETAPPPEPGMSDLPATAPTRPAHAREALPWLAVGAGVLVVLVLAALALYLR